MRNFIMVFSFISFLFIVPIVHLFSEDKTVSEQENRNLTFFPQWHSMGLSQYFDQIDLYLNDHLGLRDCFLVIHSKSKGLFLSKTSTVNGAVMGWGNWAYYVDSIATYEGKKNNIKIDAFVNGLIDFQNKFPDIPIFITIVPNKAFVYEQYLPSYVQKSNQRFETINKLEAVKGVYVLDLYTTLKNEQSPTFMPYDTHWNGWGAYVAYQSMIDFINKSLGWHLKIKNDVQELKIDSGLTGDLARMLNRPDDLLHDNNTLVFQESFAQEVPKRYQVIDAPVIPDYQNSQGDKKLFILHDSFLQHKLIPYMAETFSEITALWSFDFDKAAVQIQETKPDLIMIEIVDRHIG